MRWIYLSIIFFILFSCKSKEYFLQDDYGYYDELIFDDYILSSFSQKDILMPYVNEPVNADSIIDIFKLRLEKSGLGVRFSDTHSNEIPTDFFLTPTHSCCTDIKSNLSKHIIQVAKNQKDEVKLIPVINIKNGHGLAFGHYLYNSTLRLCVFLVKNNKIIYSNDYAIFKEFKWVLDKELEEEINKSGLNLHSDEDWDRLIHYVMTPYKERLR